MLVVACVILELLEAWHCAIGLGEECCRTEQGRVRLHLQICGLGLYGYEVGKCNSSACALMAGAERGGRWATGIRPMTNVARSEANQGCECVVSELFEVVHSNFGTIFTLRAVRQMRMALNEVPWQR